MRIIISPDSFKGTISSVHVAKTIESALKELNKDLETVCLPVADGGEGTLDAFVTATNGSLVNVPVLDPIGREINAQYSVLGDDETCVIEMAQASGITLLESHERNPLKATTYGTGQLIKHALDQGYRKFIVGLGGSATNDAGLGMLYALGAKFLDEDLQELPCEICSLSKLASINTSNLHPAVKESHFTIACDVDNPLIGERGASAVFGPQKGVKLEQVELFDQYLTQFANVVEKERGIRLHDFEGAGAAGGIGGAFKAFFPNTFKKGIDVVLNALEFDKHLKNASLVITGEGKSDIQTLSGKAPMGIAMKARLYDVPTILLSGCIDEETKDELSLWFKQIISVVGDDISTQESFENPIVALKKRVQLAFQNIV